MSWDLEGNPVDDGYCRTHMWAKEPCTECPAPDTSSTPGDLYATCPVCTAEFMALGQDPSVGGLCPACTPVVAGPGGLL